MSENYKIILDEHELNKFVNWLPELNANEVYYLTLISRKKYGGPVSNIQVKNFTAHKNNIISKIKQLQCEVGSYTFRGVPIPPESLALYIMPNPRNLELSIKKSLIDFINIITKSYNNENPTNLILSNIQKSKGSNYFVDFDFDNIDIESIQSKLSDVINLDCVSIVKTKSGFHLLVALQKISSEYKKTWYNNIKALSGSDKSGDQLLPIPGCTQGNFIPKITNFKL